MKLKHLLHFVAACALIVPAFSEDDTPLAKEMDKINKAIKFVKRNLPDAAQKSANLEKIATAIEACGAAAKFEPEKTKEIPAADKAKFLSDYKAGVEEMGKQLDALKAAIEAGKADDAKAVLDKLDSGKKEGHKKFKSDD